LLCGASGCGKTMVSRALAAHVRNELLAHAIVAPCASWTNEPVRQSDSHHMLLQSLISLIRAIALEKNPFHNHI
jgi:dethiobiotin synthetase